MQQNLFSWQSLQLDSGPNQAFYQFCDALEVKNGVSAPASGWGLDHALQAWGSYWNWDPKEVWTFIIWVVYAGYLHARATRNISRRTATWIAVAGFACIVVNYTIVNFWFVGQHSYSGVS